MSATYHSIHFHTRSLVHDMTKLEIEAVECPVDAVHECIPVCALITGIHVQGWLCGFREKVSEGQCCGENKTPLTASTQFSQRTRACW